MLRISRRKAIYVWWWISVPFTVLVVAWLNFFHPNPWQIFGTLWSWPLVYAFYVTMVSSLIWTIVATIMTVLRILPLTSISWIMLISGATATLVAVAVLRG